MRTETRPDDDPDARELADFFENASVALHLAGPDGTILRANRAELELLGYESAEYVGRPISDFHVDPAIAEDLLTRLGAGEAVRDRHARLRCKDGSVRDVLISSSARIVNGEIVHTRCFTIDVTERREVEEALSASEERFRRLTELLPVAVYTCEASSGVITYFNEHATRLWGRVPRAGDTDERFCGSFRLYRPDGSPLPHDRTPMAYALGEGLAFRNEEVVIERPDGSRITVSVDIDPIRDVTGRVVAAVNVFRDVSALKRAQGELREQKDNLQTLLETLPLAVLIAHDADATRISGNPAAAELLRMPPDANLSKSAPGEDGPAHFQVLREGEPIAPEGLPIQRAARGEVVEADPTDMSFRDGTVLHTLVYARPLVGPTGAPRGAVASILDITELREAEDALKEADQRKDAFLATLAHELRNPLAPIGYALELIKRAPQDIDVVRAMHGTMERQLRHLVRLVDDLLDVSRITRGRLELRREGVELGFVLEQAVDSCRPQIDRAGHELTLLLPPEPIHLSADPVRLAQVFGNLIGNACKYTNPGGTIRIAAAIEADEVAVTVQDTGVGLTSGAVDRVFDMFTQVDGSPGRQREGLGIGLTLVKGLVEMHGGSVAVSSEGPGRGSSFVVRLPRADGPQGARPAPPSPSAMASARRVLVVDDNREAADSLTLLLEASGHETCTVHDGPEAIEAIDRFRPEVVLLDIGLPTMSGHEVCRRARARPGGETLMLVAVTGWGQEEDRRRSRDAGFDAHLVKPVDYAELARLLSAGRAGFAPEHQEPTP